jgi:hypothetical protein
MTADRLLRLYPRPWRERYGAEFLEMIGPRPLQPKQVLDISMGAIDAWLSPDVRRSATNASIATRNGGAAMLTRLKAACGTKQVRLTPWDIFLSATVVLGGSLVMLAAGIALNRSGYPLLGEALKSLAFPVSMTASMYFSYLKDQPRRAQAAVLGVTLLILVWATWLATLI